MSIEENIAELLAMEGVYVTESVRKNIKACEAVILNAIADEVKEGNMLSDIVVEAIYRWGAPVHAGYPAKIAEQVATKFAAQLRAKGEG